MRRCSFIGLVVMGLCFPACSAAPRGLHWTIDFESTALHDQTSVVEARILRGGCTGAVLYRTEVRAMGTMAMSPPDLPAGTYGFAATAYDATCTPVGDDCQSIVLPGPTAVMNVVHAHAGMAACPAALCHSGSCEMDSGTPDAGPRDGGAIDDVGNDAFAPDMGMCAATETNCTDTIDEDCDGHTDCADTDCAGQMACALCTGVTCGACQACNPATGMCVTANDGDVCGGGHCLAGACCTGCVQGGVCVPGMIATDACGTGGNACTSCGECGTCSAGACMPGVAGTPCMSGAGSCVAGTCCTGCNQGGACQSGTLPSACGMGGNACTPCGECQSCTSGRCQQATDGSPCASGTCLNGSCCGGCLTVTGCQPGNTVTACGLGGSACMTCPDCHTCDATGHCAPAADGAACGSGVTGAGSCVGAACCTGCVAGGVCQPGNVSSLQCGFSGSACGLCPTGMSCTASGTCAGTGDTCGSYIDITNIGDVYVPIDTCAYTDNVTLNGCSTGPAPDVIFSGIQPGTYHLDLPAGWIVGYLDTFGGCSSPAGQCAAMSYGVSGSTGNPRHWFAIERADGTCGRVLVHVMGS